MTFLLLALAACGGGSSDNSNPPPKTGQTQPKFEVPLTKLSTDPFTNSDSQHATEVEPGAASNGSTIVTAFQVGRMFGGGAADIGFATSTNGGATWTSGFLPGITTNFQGGSYRAVSDPNVAYDAAHSVWLISSLALLTNGTVVVSRSLDGISWMSPVAVSATADADKNWTACDNTPSSPFYGHCYTIWDDPSNGGRVFISTSTDGGQTWHTARNTADLAVGIGAQPVIQPNGTVIVPMANNPSNTPVSAILSFRSMDGGNTWGATTTAASVTQHEVAGGLRSDALPTAQADDAGNVYVIWQDCRFRSGCASNDLVMTTSADGIIWSDPVRIPIDLVTSSADYFIPGLAIEPGTAGPTAHLALTYYFYPNAACTASTCSLNVGFISSHDGGNGWAAASTLVSGMYLSSLANTSQGTMVGDYIATVFSNGRAFPIVAVANLPNGTTFDEAMYTTATGVDMAATAHAFVSRNETVLSTRSDHSAARSTQGRHPRTAR
ncbi:MAG: sialidase family protein [Terriglobales bacterium]